MDKFLFFSIIITSCLQYSIAWIILTMKTIGQLAEFRYGEHNEIKVIV